MPHIYSHSQARFRSRRKKRLESHNQQYQTKNHRKFPHDHDDPYARTLNIYVKKKNDGCIIL